MLLNLTTLFKEHNLRHVCRYSLSRGDQFRFSIKTLSYNLLTGIYANTQNWIFMQILHRCIVRVGITGFLNGRR